MTVLIVPCVSEGVWSETFFPGMSLLHLPVAGKTWGEHLLDYCHGLGATAVRILDWTYDERLLSQHLGQGERWGFRLEYVGARIMASPEEAKRQSRAFIGDDPDVRVIWGGVFPYKGELVPLDSLEAWYRMNFTVLDDPADRTLPGYSAEKGVFIGENVAIRTHAEVTGPVVLGDNVLIEKAARLLGEVIVGRGAYVEAGCVLRRTIVCSRTYLGRNTSFEGKVVNGRRIIDPLTGVFVDLEEESLSTHLRETGSVGFLDVWEWLHAAFLALLGALPYLLVYLPLSPFLRKSAWAYKLSADRYPGILRAALMRHRLIRQSPRERRSPFGASDVLTHRRTPDERDLDDLWYRCNRTARFITAIVFKGLLNRVVSPALPLPCKEGCR